MAPQCRMLKVRVVLVHFGAPLVHFGEYRYACMVRVVLVRARGTAGNDIGPAIGIGLRVGHTTVRVMLKKDTSFSNQDNLQSAS